MALTALAGPVSNFLLALLILFIRGLLTPAALGVSWGQTALSIADTAAYMSVGLGVFNLIPIPPMDGSKLLFAILPERAYFAILRYEKYGMILIVLLVFSNVFDSPLSAAFDYVFERFFVVAQAGAKLAMML
jgi:Zn-dependent protease